MALTRSKLEANIGAVLNYPETLSSYMSARMVSLEAALQTLNDGEFFAETMQLSKNYKASSSSGLSPDTVRNFLNPLLQRELAAYLTRPQSTDLAVLLEEFRRDMIDNSKTVKERTFSPGSISADGGNTGDGELLVLDKDDNDQTLEIGNVEAQSFEIYAAQNSPEGATRHNEKGRFYGSTGPSDFWASALRTTSGLTQDMDVRSESDSFLNNPSFDSFSPKTDATTLTALSGWTPGVSIGNFKNDQVNYFTSNTGISKPASVEFTATDSLTQKMSTRNFSLNVPYIPIAYYNREDGSGGAGSGTLTLHWGSVSQALAVSAQTSWNRFPITMDKKLYFRNWREDEVEFKIDWVRTGGSILIDKVIFMPMTYFNGRWFICLGGQTPFKIGDKFTWTNTITTDSIIQKWFAILYNISFPHASSPTWADTAVIS